MNPDTVVPAWGQQAAQEHSYQVELWGPQGTPLLTPASLQPSFLRLDPGLVEGEEGQGSGDNPRAETAQKVTGPWLGGVPGSGNDPSGCSDPCSPPLSPPPAHHGSAPGSQPRHLELGQTKGCKEGQ